MKILIVSSIHPPRVEMLKKEHDVICAFNAKEDELIEKIKDREVIILRSGVQITAKVMEAAPNLKLLLRAGSGTDNIDMDYVAKRGLRLVRIPEPGAKAVAEMAFSMMLNLARNVPIGDRSLREGKWRKTELTGYLLTGKTLGVIGAGNIGSRVAWMGAAWGMNAIACVSPENMTPELIATQEARGVRLTNFEEVLTKSDFVCLHVPLMDSTRNLIGEAELAKMKPTAYLINLARGGVMNEAAVYNALKNGKLAGVGTDVHENEGKSFKSPFVEMENVVLTPHIGAQTYDSQAEIGDRVAEILNEYKNVEVELSHS